MSNHLSGWPIFWIYSHWSPSSNSNNKFCNFKIIFHPQVLPWIPLDTKLGGEGDLCLFKHWHINLHGDVSCPRRSHSAMLAVVCYEFIKEHGGELGRYFMCSSAEFWHAVKISLRRIMHHANVQLPCLYQQRKISQERIWKLPGNWRVVYKLSSTDFTNQNGLYSAHFTFFCVLRINSFPLRTRPCDHEGPSTNHSLLPKGCLDHEVRKWEVLRALAAGAGHLEPGREAFHAAQGPQLFPCDWGFHFQAILDHLQLAMEMPDPLWTHSRLLLDGRLDPSKTREQHLSHFQRIGT